MEDNSSLKKEPGKHKYLSKEKLVIATKTRKTIKYIENTVNSVPNKCLVLKNKTLNNLYEMLENIYRANILQEIQYKKEVIVNIQLLNYYLEELYNKNLISYRKLVNYGKHLLEIDYMVRSWMNYEKNE